ncbi:hypothetical protein [Mycolicibacter icosiumassiliensis]|uniref:hypothetical protein n=1 Tax=Mycolicibacter icosiumassiliensis TaxID=1792835 RepID=UPI00082CE450|nr:hypothetical protein [Mycolicibacter icosiumassiliensis]
MLTVGHANEGNAPLVPPEWPPAARIAVELFLEFMHNKRVRPYDIATRCRTRSLTRHVPVGPRREIVRSFELAPPFWPVTIDTYDGLLAGYGIDRYGACIRYTQNPYPLTSRADDVTVQRVQFSQGCQNVLRRATRTNPAFICEPLPPWRAVQVVREYLIDAAISLSEGRGPIIEGAMRAAQASPTPPDRATVS